MTCGAKSGFKQTDAQDKKEKQSLLTFDSTQVLVSIVDVGTGSGMVYSGAYNFFF